MDQQLIQEIGQCDMMIKSYTSRIEDYQIKKQHFINLQRLLPEPEPEAVVDDDSDDDSSYYRPFLDDNGKPHLFLDDDGNTIMSREGSCDDSVYSTGEDCLIDEIKDLKLEIIDFKNHIDKAIKTIDARFYFIQGGCRGD